MKALAETIWMIWLNIGLSRKITKIRATLIFEDRPTLSHINGKLSPRPFEWYGWTYVHLELIVLIRTAFVFSSKKTVRPPWNRYFVSGPWVRGSQRSVRFMSGVGVGFIPFPRSFNWFRFFLEGFRSRQAGRQLMLRGGETQRVRLRRGSATHETTMGVNVTRLRTPFSSVVLYSRLFRIFLRFLTFF